MKTRKSQKATDYDPLDNKVKKYAPDNNILTLTVRKGRLFLNGSKKIVDFAHSNESLKKLFEKMLEESDEVNDVYSEQSKLVFPPLKAKFGSAGWNWRVCRDELIRYFEILGFSRNGPKHFKKIQFKPSWFPAETVDWSRFSTSARMERMTNNILLSVTRR